MIALAINLFSINLYYEVLKQVSHFVRQFANGFKMGVDEEIKTEIRRLEAEISLIDNELEKLHSKILQILALRKNKEKSLKSLRPDPEEPKDIQTSLVRLQREIREYK